MVFPPYHTWKDPFHLYIQSPFVLPFSELTTTGNTPSNFTSVSNTKSFPMLYALVMDTLYDFAFAIAIFLHSS